jgi:hypothetical protein
MSRHLAGAILWAMLAGSAPRAEEIIERVLAVAGGKIIMLSDVRAALDLGLVDTGGASDPLREALTRLIDRALVLAEVDRYLPPEPSAADVDRRFQSVTARLLSRPSLAAALARHGMDEGQLRERLREDLRIQAYLDQRFVADTADRHRVLVDEWVAGLRRRAEIVDLYRPLP